MSDEVIYADTVAVLVILATMMEALECQQPGIKRVMAETIEGAIKDLPDQDDPHSTKATLQKFHGFITRDNPMEMLFH